MKLPATYNNTILDKIFQKFPILGKILSTLFGALELPFLEFFRRIDTRFHIESMEFLNRRILKGRWGGRVIPLNINLYPETCFSPTEEIIEIIKRSNITGISYCYCRNIQRSTSTPNCDHPLYTCIHVGFGKSLYEIPMKSENLKKVSKDEVIQLLEECDERGLVHQLIYFPNPQFYYVICNCCPCCCVLLSKFLKQGSPQMIKSEFIAITDDSLCSKCGNCIEWCYFNAREFHKDSLMLNIEKCFGCGLCISKCPNKAIKLKRKSKYILQ
ncbi:MAG: hypothetical protein GF317_16550 [Candidatus Lokiarchaeota archaeon]|nr:hypothetical protein [Candidatus Lokiarchaeota archaeon]MBD3201130.1 hypothetical protein [Candidatus Lokiarchaeota archaeon]